MAHDQQWQQLPLRSAVNFLQDFSSFSSLAMLFGHWPRRAALLPQWEAKQIIAAKIIAAKSNDGNWRYATSGKAGRRYRGLKKPGKSEPALLLPLSALNRSILTGTKPAPADFDANR